MEQIVFSEEEIENVDFDFLATIANVSYRDEDTIDTILSDNTPDARELKLKQNYVEITFPFEKYKDKYGPELLVEVMSNYDFEMAQEFMNNYIDDKIRKVIPAVDIQADAVKEEVNFDIKREQNNDIKIIVSWMSIIG